MTLGMELISKRSRCCFLTSAFRGLSVNMSFHHWVIVVRCSATPSSKLGIARLKTINNNPTEPRLPREGRPRKGYKCAVPRLYEMTNRTPFPASKDRASLVWHVRSRSGRPTLWIFSHRTQLRFRDANGGVKSHGYIVQTVGC